MFFSSSRIRSMIHCSVRVYFLQIENLKKYSTVTDGRLVTLLLDYTSTTRPTIKTYQIKLSVGLQLILYISVKFLKIVCLYCVPVFGMTRET